MRGCSFLWSSLCFAWLLSCSLGFTVVVSPSHRDVKVRSSVVVAATTGPSVLDKPGLKKKSKQKENQQDLGAEGWEVRLYNDPFNKREFVARCLMEIVGISETASYQIMMGAHQVGIAAIGRYHRERAELYRDRLTEEGLVCDMVPVDDDK
mmetsp:Transcript_4095/g.3882  ORF Transcript_4095/g.3882 Transcript_4095/m.3882 type:complete len:151 (-) Transcript_4095:485-937(-)